MTESCHAYEGFISLLRMRHVALERGGGTREWVMSHKCMSPRLIYSWVMSHTFQSCHTHLNRNVWLNVWLYVIPVIRIAMNESCRTWVMCDIFLFRDVTSFYSHTNRESCQYEWVMSKGIGMTWCHTFVLRWMSHVAHTNKKMSHIWIGMCDIMCDFMSFLSCLLQWMSHVAHTNKKMSHIWIGMCDIMCDFMSFLLFLTSSWHDSFISTGICDIVSFLFRYATSCHSYVRHDSFIAIRMCDIFAIGMCDIIAIGMCDVMSFVCATWLIHRSTNVWHHVIPIAMCDIISIRNVRRHVIPIQMCDIILFVCATWLIHLNTNVWHHVIPIDMTHSYWSFLLTWLIRIDMTHSSQQKGVIPWHCDVIPIGMCTFL